MRISSSGMEWDPVGDMMRSSRSNRSLRLDGAPVDWATICDPDSDPAKSKDKLRRLAMRYAIKLLTDSTSTVLALGLENSPLGMTDPTANNSGPFEPNNPIEVGDADPGFTNGIQQARFARAVGEQFILRKIHRRMTTGCSTRSRSRSSSKRRNDLSRAVEQHARIVAAAQQTACRSSARTARSECCVSAFPGRLCT